MSTMLTLLGDALSVNPPTQVRPAVDAILTIRRKFLVLGDVLAEEGAGLVPCFICIMFPDPPRERFEGRLALGRHFAGMSPLLSPLLSPPQNNRRQLRPRLINVHQHFAGSDKCAASVFFGVNEFRSSRQDKTPNISHDLVDGG